MALDIRSARQLRRMRQRDLADAVGISLNELIKLERGLIVPPKNLLARLSDCLDMDVNQLTVGHNELLKNPLTGEGYITARPERPTRIPRRKTPDLTKKAVFDLFCGVGGFSFGLEMNEAFQVVAGIDILGDRLGTFSRNHDTANAYGEDIRAISTDILESENPRPFVIVGGAPCQGFSSISHHAVPFRFVENHRVDKVHSDRSGNTLL